MNDIAKEEMKVLSDEAKNPITPQDNAEEKENKLLSLWKGRFDRAEKYRNAHIDRMMRMYKLYRAYRDANNYAYGTSIMPPKGFEIIETIKPRLSSAEIEIDLQPTKEAYVNDPLIKDWETLIEYNLSVLGDKTGFDDIKISWITAMLLYGNGVVQLSWSGDENGHPYAEVVDNFLLYIDPKATNRMLDSRYEIRQTFKDKAIIMKEEEKRGAYRLYNESKLEKLEDKPIAKDPRNERVRINTLKMGQINDGIKKDKAVDQTGGAGTSGDDKNSGENQIEIWECWDHVTDKLVVIMNRESVVREDENPYKKIREGRMFIDLPDISLNHEYYAMGHLEPVETTIHEMADSRNQAMDDIVFSLDPIRKIKKGQGYKPEDLKHAPGAIWELNNVSDVVIETGPQISSSWIAKDNVLNQSIQTALALSEYAQGIPQASQEPASKVEMLLLQTNIRFSLLVRQMEIAFEDMVNAMIEMNQEFLGDQMEYRITGTKIKFGRFGNDAKQIGIDARVNITPKPEKSAQQEANETISLYKLLITDEIPLLANATPEEVQDFKRKKRVMQSMLIKAFGRAKYEKEIMGEEIETATPTEEAGKNQEELLGKRIPQLDPVQNENITTNQPIAEMLTKDAPNPISLIPEEAIPGVETDNPQNLLSRLFKFKR